MVLGAEEIRIYLEEPECKFSRHEKELQHCEWIGGIPIR